MYAVRLAVPLYLTDKGAPTEQIGLVLAVNTLSTSLLSVPMGLVSDRIGKKRATVAGLLLVTVSIPFFINTDEILLILLASLTMGIGWGTFEPAMVAGMIDLTKPGRIGRTYAGYSASFQAAIAIGPALAGFTIDSLGYTETFLASTILASLAVMFSLIGMPKSLDQTVKAADISIVKSFATLGKPVKIGLSGTFAVFFTIGGFESFFPVYAKVAGLSAITIGLLFSAQSIISLLSRIPLGYALDKAKTKTKFMAAGIVLTGITVILVPLTLETLPLLLILGAMTIGRGLTNVSSSTVIAEGAPPSSRGLSMGLSSMFRMGGMSVGPAAMAPMIILAGYRTAFPALGLISVIGALLITLWNRTKGKAP